MARGGSVRCMDIHLELQRLADGINFSCIFLFPISNVMLGSFYNNLLSEKVCFLCQVGLRHKINDDLMLYPGYIPRPGVEPILLHYGLQFNVGNWSFSKMRHHEDGIVYDCNRLFPEPPYPREVRSSMVLLPHL